MQPQDTDTTPHALKLRAIQQDEDGQPKKASGFKIGLTNVVTAQVNSQVLVFVTDSSVKVIGAKVRTVSNQLIDLVPSTDQTNAFSLAGLPIGVYTLDIITQKGNTKAAYEGILVISQQPTTVISENTRNVINQEINQKTRVDTDTHVKVILKENDDDDQDNDDNDKRDKKRGNDCWEGTRFIGKDKCDTGGLPICSEVEPKGSKGCFDDKDYPQTPENGYPETDENENNEEETENCGGEPCTPTEKEDSTLDDDTEYVDDEPEYYENNDGALGDPITDEKEIEEIEEADAGEEDEGSEDESDEEGDTYEESSEDFEEEDTGEDEGSEDESDEEGDTYEG